MATASSTSSTTTTTNTATNAEPLPWSTGKGDALARIRNTCTVKRTLNDSGPGALPNTTIEIVDDTCESGLPHTSDAHTIRMTEGVWNSSRRETILTHERVHLEQRRAPDTWKEFYRAKWNYTITDTPPKGVPATVIGNLRGNPDIHPERWACWGERYWFLTTYTDTMHPTLTGAVTRVWDAKTSTWVQQPREWRAFFCTAAGECPSQWEHPHELAAEMWADLERWTTPAAVALRNFMSSFN